MKLPSGITVVGFDDPAEIHNAIAQAVGEPTRLPRSLSTIARDIRRHWPAPFFGAVPYLDAMHSLDTMKDDYGHDSAESIVLYFLSNAAHWRGPDAKRIKAELKAMLPKRGKR